MEEETHDLLEAWGPKYSILRRASQREKVQLWNEIFAQYQERYSESQRTLAQVKKQQQKLEYDYKLLKQRSQSTREAGIKKIKDGFPYFDFFDDVMGHHDSVDPAKTAIEESCTFASSAESMDDASAMESVLLNDSESPDQTAVVEKSSGKRQADDKPSGREGKRRR